MVLFFRERYHSMENNQVVEYISLGKLKPNPKQPRGEIDNDDPKLKELADSIRKGDKGIGIIHPIIAEKVTDGEYIIIDGERRVKAAKIAGLTDVPVILRNYSDKERERMVVSLIANIQRADLNSIEKASAYQNIMDDYKIDQKDLAEMVGKNRSTVANAFRILKKLPLEMKTALQEKRITTGHVMALLMVSEKDEQEKLFKEIIDKKFSVRDAERRARKIKGKTTGKKSSDEIEKMETKLIKHLGIKVVIINGNDDKGTIVIKYFNFEQCKRICKSILVSSK